MKKIIIIDTYPSTQEHIDCLGDCVDRLRNKGYDLMIVSHLPVPLEVQNKANYFIYDKENLLLPYHLTPYTWLSNESFYLRANARGHQITICKNMHNGISMANSLKYEFFIFMEADNLFESEDFEKLDQLGKTMFENDKNMLFFKYKQYESDVYETLIFGGKPSYFLEKAMIPTNLEEYIEWVSVDGNFISQSLELSFYKRFDEKDFLLEIETSSNILFNNSTINKYSGCDHLCEVLTNNSNDKFILFIKNFGAKKVNFNIDGIDNMLEPGCWSYRYIDNDIEISVLIYDGDEIVGRKSFIVNEENRKSFSEKAYIEFNNLTV